MSPLYLYNNKLLITVDGKLATGQECCCGGECPPGDGCGIGAGVSPCVSWRGPYLTEQEAQQAGDDWVAENDAFFECAMRSALEAAGYTNIQAGGGAVTYEWCGACEGLCFDENGQPSDGPLYSIQASWGVTWDCGECNSGAVDPEDLECQDWTECPFVNPNEDGDSLYGCATYYEAGIGEYPPPVFCVPRCNPFP